MQQCPQRASCKSTTALLRAEAAAPQCAPRCGASSLRVTYCWCTSSSCAGYMWPVRDRAARLPRLSHEQHLSNCCYVCGTACSQHVLSTKQSHNFVQGVRINYRAAVRAATVPGSLRQEQPTMLSVNLARFISCRHSCSSSYQVLSASAHSENCGSRRFRFCSWCEPRRRSDTCDYPHDKPLACTTQNRCNCIACALVICVTRP